MDVVDLPSLVGSLPVLGEEVVPHPQKLQLPKSQKFYMNNYLYQAGNQEDGTLAGVVHPDQLYPSSHTGSG
jgi:hypothetical protein